MKKLIKKSFHRKEKGFTLIELLIVIVIIGILAGVLIAVINPVRQQNRSRNAAVRASMLKAAFAVNTVRAGIGELPSNTKLPIELENTTVVTDNCTDPDNCLDAFVTISGTQMPNVCGADGVAPQNGAVGPCYMHILSVGPDLLSGQFRIVAAKFYLNPAATSRVDEIFVFDSTAGLMLCPGATNYQNYVDPDDPANNIPEDLSSCIPVETGDEDTTTTAAPEPTP